MLNTLRLLLVIVIAFIIGSAVNMAIIMLSSSVIPLPEGVDPSNFESLKAGIQLFKPYHFIMPWLAHALGTLAGAFAAAVFTKKSKLAAAISIGVLFLAGGIANILMLPSPMWFILLDLVIAYIPMSLLGYKLATSKRG